MQKYVAFGLMDVIQHHRMSFVLKVRHNYKTLINNNSIEIPVHRGAVGSNFPKQAVGF